MEGALLTALLTKFSGSAFSTAVGGRIFADFAPPEAELPYCVFFIVAGNPEDTFKNKIDDTTVQFSLYSASADNSEITDIYTYLKAILDDAVLSVSGYTLIWCVRQRLATMVEEVEAAGAVTRLRHWAVDYSIKVQD